MFTHNSLKIENNSFDIFDSSLHNSFDTIRVLLYFSFAREQQIKIKIKVNSGVANYTNFEVKDAKLTQALILEALYLYYALFWTTNEDKQNYHLSRGVESIISKPRASSIKTWGQLNSIRWFDALKEPHAFGNNKILISKQQYFHTWPWKS